MKKPKIKLNFLTRVMQALRIQNFSSVFSKFFRRPVQLPENVLVSASHGSARFPIRLFRHLTVYYQTSPRLLLNFSDYGTKTLLEQVPEHQKAIPKYGRIVGDPNRDLRQDDLIRFEDFGGNKIFRSKFEKRLTKSFLRFIWRRKLLNYSYRPYYRTIQKKLETIARKTEDSNVPIIFVDVHDVGNLILGQRAKEDIARKEKMPKIVISSAPDLEVEEWGSGTAPEYFVKEFADVLAKNLKIESKEVKINKVYKGGNIIRYFGNTRNNPRLKRALKGRKIFAIQVEFNRSWYLNEKNQIIHKEKMRFVRNGFMKTLKQVSDMDLGLDEDTE